MTLRPACAVLAVLLPAGAPAMPDPAAWPVLPPRFESTGGGGVIIDEYRPVVVGDRCVTRFTATTPAGEVFVNYALFEAVPLAGGVLCRAGRWGAVESSATGTTPLVVWLKDGVMRRAPAD
ncbi:hypothetical protein [Paracraurococcus ruber]|uniref:Uncharacterized protein n=1 Tax=Paracraurococcus ruber TaxID=77675 RepID=A0ABS1CZ47_9PROT|nr:hypothetical protein [Paracraurococcus ruber]MBK1659805.1 hypothetical protein [Paracraurococcus ruber]TDG34148.1 hypothetical protein E2C05_01350 [Paracraurococcus ruber]